MYGFFKREDYTIVLVFAFIVAILVFIHVSTWKPPILESIYNSYPELRGKNLSYVEEYLSNILDNITRTKNDLLREYNETKNPKLITVIVNLETEAKDINESLAELKLEKTCSAALSISDVSISSLFASPLHIVTLVVSLIGIVKYSSLYNTGLLHFFTSASGRRKFHRVFMEKYILVTLPPIVIIDIGIIAGVLSNNNVLLDASNTAYLVASIALVDVGIVLECIVALSIGLVILLETRGVPMLSYITVITYTLFLQFLLPLIASSELLTITIMGLRPADTFSITLPLLIAATEKHISSQAIMDPKTILTILQASTIITVLLTVTILYREITTKDL